MKKDLSFWRKIKYREDEPLKLRIPSFVLPSQVKKFQDRVLLQIPNVDQHWHVKLVCKEDKIFMTDGLGEFCKYFRIKAGSIIWFELVVDNVFNVKVGKPDGIEKNYMKYITALELRNQTHDNQDAESVSFGFCVFLILTKATIRLPHSFFLSCNYTLASDIILKVNGNYNWIVKCDFDRCVLTSTEEFLNTIVPHRYFPIVFKYVGMNTFHVSVFDTCGLEIDYKKKCDNASKSLYMSKSRCSSSRQKKPWFYNDTLLSTNKALAQYLVNGFSYDVNRIQFTIKGMHLYSNTEHVIVNHEYFQSLKKTHLGGKIWFVLGNLEFLLTYVWMDGEFQFNRGWNNFIQKTELKIGDMLVIQPQKESFKFLICIIPRRQLNMSTILSGNNIGGATFASIVNEHSLIYGKVAIPVLVQVACARSLGKIIHCHLKNGSTLNIQYYTSDCAFNGFQKLFRKLRIAVNDVIIVSIIDPSNISLTFYKKNGPELKLTEEFVTQIEEDATCSKRRKISEYTATPGEELFEVVHIKEEIEGLNVSITQSKNEPNIAENEDISANLLAESNEKIYEVCLGRSHVDMKSRGVYLHQELQKVLRHWPDESIAKLRVGNRTWAVRLIRNNKSLRFGAGWNDFVDKNKLKESQKLTYSLINSAEKLFDFKI